MGTDLYPVVVEEGTYQLLLSAEARPYSGGIIFVEGTIQAGPEAGTPVDVFTVVLHRGVAQKSVGLKQLQDIGIGIETLNEIARQTGVVSERSMMPLYRVVAEYVSSRQVTAELVHNTYEGRHGRTTRMTARLGSLTLLAILPPLLDFFPEGGA